jgi:hypothetical protein
MNGRLEIQAQYLALLVTTALLGKQTGVKDMYRDILFTDASAAH